MQRLSGILRRYWETGNTNRSQTEPETRLQADLAGRRQDRLLPDAPGADEHPHPPRAQLRPCGRETAQAIVDQRPFHRRCRPCRPGNDRRPCRRMSTLPSLDRGRRRQTGPPAECPSTTSPARRTPLQLRHCLPPIRDPAPSRGFDDLSVVARYGRLRVQAFTFCNTWPWTPHRPAHGAHPAVVVWQWRAPTRARSYVNYKHPRG
jgi:hypothetical protein